MATTSFEDDLKKAEKALSKYNEKNYNTIKDMISALNNMLVLISNLSKIINAYPMGVSAQNIALLYKTLFWKNSYNYTTTRKSLEDDFNSFLNKYKSSSSIMEFLLNYVKVLPSKLPDALDNKDIFLKILTDMKDVIISYKNSLADTLILTSGNLGLRDRRIANLKSRMDSALQSITSEGYVDSQTTIKTQQVKLNEALASAKKKDAEFKQFIAQLEQNTNATTLISKAKNFLNLTRKNITMGRNVISTPPTGKETHEEYWRNKIRKKYGNDVPFCDEVDAEGNPVLIVDSNGRKVFAKAKDVLKVGDDFILLQDAKMKEIKKVYGNPNDDAY